MPTRMPLAVLLIVGAANIASTAMCSSWDCGLCGTWMLVDRIDRTAAGEVLPEPGLGSDPAGILVYDRAGNIAVQLMKRHRANVRMAATASQTATSATNSVTADGYDAYFGTYEVNAQKHTVTHHIKGALAAGDVGKSLTRSYRLSGDELLLSFDTVNGVVPVHRTLRWKRAA